MYSFSGPSRPLICHKVKSKAAFPASLWPHVLIQMRAATRRLKALTVLTKAVNTLDELQDTIKKAQKSIQEIKCLFVENLLVRCVMLSPSQVEKFEL